MKRVLRYALPAVALLALTALLLWFRGDIGIPRSRIAADVRADLPVGALLQAEYGEKLAAVLVETEGEPALRVYVNRPGLSFGWFFRYGGSAPAGQAVCFTGAGERLCAAGYGHGIVSVSVGGGAPFRCRRGPLFGSSRPTAARCFMMPPVPRRRFSPGHCDTGSIVHPGGFHKRPPGCLFFSTNPQVFRQIM